MASDTIGNIQFAMCSELGRQCENFLRRAKLITRLIDNHFAKETPDISDCMKNYADIRLLLDILDDEICSTLTSLMLMEQRLMSLVPRDEAQQGG